jgi:DNA-binding transcriptional MerR regulator
MKDFGIKKLYYSISEVSKLTGLEQYILRYWETEFPQLKPQKNRSGNRIYTNKDIDLIIRIKKLLRDKKYTITGAKDILESFQEDENTNVINNSLTEQNPSENTSIIKDLLEIKQFLLDLKSKL